MSSLLKLKEEFKPTEIEWRIVKSGITNGKPWARIIPYIDSRAVQERLDEVVGPDNWQTKLTSSPSGVLCELSIMIGDTWVSKTDGSEETEYHGFKGGCSRALVRAAVLWGIGRYLYNTPEMWAFFVDRREGANWIQIEGKDYYWISDQVEETSPAPKNKISLAKTSSIPKTVAIHSTHTNGRFTR